MIDFSAIERQLPRLRDAFRSARPYPYVAIDGFCDPVRLGRLVEVIPDPATAAIRKSRDYVFARNKFEKSQFRVIDPLFEELYQDLVAERFQEIVCAVTGETVFIDRDFHGGGIHQGGEASFLDMHVDFDRHPLHPQWRRNLNILLYLNRNWRTEYGGALKLRHKETGEATQVEPLFNRCVIMQSRDATLHGYDRINFPRNEYRRSIAAYAYTLLDGPARAARSTVWYPERAGLGKRVLGRAWPFLVTAKNRLFGSATAKNS
jgi:hypothetical protein